MFSKHNSKLRDFMLINLYKYACHAFMLFKSIKYAYKFIKYAHSIHI